MSGCDACPVAAVVVWPPGAWMHVDGAYGGAGLFAPSVRGLYAGLEHADSFCVDPHKWLFGPFDCCALMCVVTGARACVGVGVGVSVSALCFGMLLRCDRGAR